MTPTKKKPLIGPWFIGLGWLVFFTGVLAVVGGLQFWAFVESERAFLSVINLTINGGFPSPGERTMRVLVQVKNGGKSTAFVKNTTIGVRFGKLAEEPDYGNEPQLVTPPIPADGIANDHDVIVFPRGLTQEEIDVVKAGTSRMSIF